MVERKRPTRSFKHPTLGLALGAGGAKGFVHLGVLKALHRHKLFPSYIAGTSMGSVIAAAYAAGRSPEEIENFIQHTDWREVVDFTVPKVGLLAGKRVDKKIGELVFNKKFSEVSLPLRIVAYNLTKGEKAIFEQGEIASAVRASISIPGVFKPKQIKKEQFIDGAVVDPNPFKVVKEMGADIVLAVDTTNPPSKPAKKFATPEATFLQSLKEKFIRDEVTFLGVILFPGHWPAAIRKSLRWLLKTIFYPARVLRMLAGKEPYPIVKIMYETINLLKDNLAREQLAQAKDCLIISPKIDRLQWSDFHKIDVFIKIGEEATEKIIPELKRRMGKL